MKNRQRFILFLIASTCLASSCDPVTGAAEAIQAKRKSKELLDSFNAVNARLDSINKAYAGNRDSLLQVMDSLKKELQK